MATPILGVKFIPHLNIVYPWKVDFYISVYGNTGIENVFRKLGMGVESLSVAGMGDVVLGVSSGVGGTVHQVTAGVKRLLTDPPESPRASSGTRGGGLRVEGVEEEEEEEWPGVLPPTPRNSTLSPVSDDPYSDL